MKFYLLAKKMCLEFSKGIEGQGYQVKVSCSTTSTTDGETWTPGRPEAKCIVARQSEALMEELCLSYKTSVSALQAYAAGHGWEA